VGTGQVRKHAALALRVSRQIIKGKIAENRTQSLHGYPYGYLFGYLVVDLLGYKRISKDFVDTKDMNYYYYEEISICIILWMYTDKMTGYLLDILEDIHG
jgi:hypothetical protein